MSHPLFTHYAALFASRGYSLYFIGGTSRDLLLGLVPSDFDFVTDATPEQEKEFLPNADYSFAKYGSLCDKSFGVECDFVSMREEGEYKDHRHPSYISFIKDPKKDSERRDFTINALYLNPDSGELLDFHGGMEDLKNKQVRFIGDPRKRIEEDPLRILRAERFARRLGFSIEPESQKAIHELRGLLSELNPQKVLQEQKKG